MEDVKGFDRTDRTKYAALSGATVRRRHGNDQKIRCKRLSHSTTRLINWVAGLDMVSITDPTDRIHTVIHYDWRAGGDMRRIGDPNDRACARQAGFRLRRTAARHGEDQNSV